MRNVLRFVLAALVLLSAHALAAERITYFVSDANGSPIAAMDEQGNVLWRESYMPWGARLTREPANDARTAYTGKPEDTDTGLVYMGARWYDPETSRFTGIDPQGFNADNPQSWGRYLYANNSPYNFVDPDGEAPIAAPLIALVVQEATGAAVESATGVDVPLTKSRAVSKAIKKASFGGVAPPKAGEKVYRVYGENNKPFGRYWTSVDPRKTVDFRDAAGLPDQNTGRFVIEGTLKNADGVTTRRALPIGDRKGGIRELEIPDAENQVDIKRVSGVNPQF